MHQLSSQVNLVLKLFLPLFLTTLLVLFSFALFALETTVIFGFPIATVRYVMPVIVSIFVLFWWRFLWPLHRIDADETHVYISNYDKTARYPHSEIKALRRKFIGPFEIIYIDLVAPGMFGSRIKFIASRRRLATFAAGQQDWEILLGKS